MVEKHVEQLRFLLTAASMLAGNSSLGLESITIILER
jgi:hypothetical protein